MMEELLCVFKEIAEENFPELDLEKFSSELREEIKKKKYDLQDEALLETALRDDREAFKNSFLEMLEEQSANEKSSKAFILSDRGREKAISILIDNTEHTIDYYYNTIIGKHFSAT
ncbi:MAG: hypothetical protein OXF23_01815 [Candidatus Dadabacteria bacterium]|nr:hypothetical protein [Candidatus Dadabacteria bacterium]MCY4262374.1 hypothetical protein [Candidatus Dadabacteria bacterium]